MNVAMTSETVREEHAYVVVGVQAALWDVLLLNTFTPSTKECELVCLNYLRKSSALKTAADLHANSAEIVNG
jgi:hypothetical protein